MSTALLGGPNPESPAPQTAMPVGRSFASDFEWLTEVQKRAATAGYTVGSAIGMEQHANKHNNPTTMEQFMFHLALAFGGGGAWESNTVALIRETEENRTVSIRLSRMSPGSKTLKDFELLNLSSRLSHQLQSVSHGGTEGDLYATVFHLYRARTQRSISQLRVLFRENQEQLDQMISNIFGVFDDHSQPHDGSLKDHLTVFHCLISQMDSQFRVEPRSEFDVYDEMNAIVETAYQIYSLEENGVQKRLQVLAGVTLAEPLHNHIQTLARPKQCHNALVSYARCRGFDSMNIGYGMPPTPENANKVAASTTSKSFSARSAEHEIMVPSSNQSQSSSAVIMDLSTLARTYLSATDSHLSPQVLQPHSKRHAFSLMAFVLNDLAPEPKSDIYYSFGFAACESEAAENLLSTLYKKLLTTSRDKRYAFEELWQSLESYTLTQLFDRNGMSNFRTELPLLEQFFDLSLEARASVFRLIQFLRVNKGNHDDSDPVACGGLVLIRDYGFHLCKGREDVEILKETYRRALKEINALDLHAACVGMQLRETVLATNVVLEPKYQRLLQNQGPLPDLGFEKIVSDFDAAKACLGKTRKETERREGSGSLLSYGTPTTPGGGRAPNYL